MKVTGDDIQLHGGVGFTWANDAHFLFKRAKQNETLVGGSGHQWQRVSGSPLHRRCSPDAPARSVPGRGPPERPSGGGT